MIQSAIPTSLLLNIGGRLLSLDHPRVMGILNATPDSFYAGSRCGNDETIIANRARAIIEEGGDMIDVGAYSSRPDATDIPLEEEWQRLDRALSVIRGLYPDAILSVDTFRAEIARRSVERHGVQIINDISGGELDKTMFETVASLHVPYILMHMRGTPQTMQQQTHYDNLMAEITGYFARRVDRLHQLGVSDIILDPGFGFSKTLDDNYLLMHRLHELQPLGLPILTGISRKSMIYKLLGSSPEESLTGTTVLNTIALMGGTHILRVHDVREAVETVKIVTKTLSA
ncbi:MAG TPA: dihydropteroate synthase [Candidatus Caccoplasma intestinavium]|uniref:dihydropteroate synthase n=1 Tax=Candidatus Caccoplasma intestinavium TaxID=2840716 RepID=A0A9D1KEJ3_9BACT|nr:dihydropteroate synthase [Candidatus Caccoplasma intestinavium]